MKTTGVFKKYLSLVIVVILLLTLSVPAMAKSPINFSEKIQTKNSVIFYEIEISPDSNICGLSFELKYSENQVKVNNCTVGEILDGGISKSNSTIGGKVVFTYISTTPLKDSGSILLVEFEALSNDNKNISIDCKITECINKDCNEIAYTFSEKEISNPKYVEPTQNKDNPNNVTNNKDINHNQTNIENSTDNKDGSDKTSTTAPPSSDQKDSTTEKPTNNPSETVSDEMINNNDESNLPTNNDNSESDLSSSESHKSDENISKDTDKEVEQGKTANPKSWLVILICIAIVLLVVCLMIVKPTLLKRRSRNEKK